MTLPNAPLPEAENEEVAPGRSSRLAVWLIILGLGVLFLPLYLTGTTIQESSVTLEAELTEVVETLAYTPPPNPTGEALSSTLVWVRGQAVIMESLQTTLTALHIDWPSVMAVVGSYDPAQMSITGVTQTAATIVVKGRASQQSVIMSYAGWLRDSALFETVNVGSITMETLPTATPLPTSESTAEPASAAPPEPQLVAVFEISLTMKAEGE